MNTIITTLTDDQIYTSAADALTAGNLDIYEAIKAAAPRLDWAGHDRRAALARGATLQTLERDPAQVSMLIPDPCRTKLLAIQTKSKATTTTTAAKRRSGRKSAA